ncbi:hypothetical protein AMECASPLE_003537 [Ameca splendens]|uniref:Uncharacterized protein n=1 Tax=Ameca splendens TaxID=208324 RepID=A0ABV1A606_9TELE
MKWCYRCLCDFGLQDSGPYCKMTSENFFNLPLNIYIIILGISLFILMLSLIFCCYLFRSRGQKNLSLSSLSPDTSSSSSRESPRRSQASRETRSLQCILAVPWASSRVGCAWNTSQGRCLGGTDPSVDLLLHPALTRDT